MLPYQMIAGGTFQVSVSGSTAAAVEVVCQSQNPPDFIIARSITGWGEVNQAQAIEWWWERSMSQGTARGTLQSSHASAPALTSKTLTSNGIFTYDTANPPTFTALTATTITGNAGTFIVSMANTGDIAVGDWVRLTSVVGERQISGYVFQVTAVTTNVSITLGYMASSGITFGADASSAQVTKFIPNRFYPRWAYIANITKATQAVIYFTGKNDFTPGEIVSFRVPELQNGQTTMTEMNNLQGRVLSVTNSSTVSSITVDIDTTGFTTFAFSTSLASLAVSPAVVVPSSSGVVPFNGSATIAQQPPGTNLLDAFDNRNTRVIVFGHSLFDTTSFVSTDADVWSWQAFKYDQYNNQ
jgi:hypothetical protein